jgi:hypothetical protein
MFLRRYAAVLLAASFLFVSVRTLLAQAGFDDDRVMLQGFYYESYRFGHTDRFPALGTQKWSSRTDEITPDQ